MANGLTGIDLVRCWVSWSILPLRRRTRLMHEYTGDVKDPQRHTEIQMTEDEITKSVKKMLDEPITECSKTGLRPYYASHEPPAVRIVFSAFLIRPLIETFLMAFCLSLQDKDPFWKKKTEDKPAKPQDKPVRAPRAKSMATKRPAKKKTAESSNPPEDIDDSEPEVKLDSLGSFFIHLIDNDHYQDDAEASRANHVEVISLSSNSDLVPVRKIRRAVRKVKRSHPFTPLDPQHPEARRTTRHSGQQVTSSCLPDTPIQKRRAEVSCNSKSLIPWRVTSDTLLIRLTQIIR